MKCPIHSLNSLKVHQCTCFESSVEASIYFHSLQKAFFPESLFAITFLHSAQISQFFSHYCEFVVLLHKTASQNELESYKIDGALT